MILTYAEIAETAARKGEPVVSPLVLAAGYIAVWLGAAVVLAALQIVLARAGAARSRDGVGEPAVLRRGVHRRRRSISSPR